MKKFLSKLLLFLVLVSALVFFIARFDNADRFTNSDHNVVKIGHMSAFDSLDILFLGNSYCYSSVYGPLFDSMHLRIFNLGVATSGPRFYELLLNDYLSSVRKNPDTVMMLVSPTTFSTQADDWKDYPIHRYLSHPLSNEKLALTYGVEKDYPAMVFNSVRKGLNNLLTRNAKADNQELNRIYSYRGLFVDSTVTSDSLERSISHLFVPLRRDHFDKKAAELLLRLSQRIRSQGMQVIFFETPTHHLNQYFSEEFLGEYERFCTELSRNYPVIRNGLQLDARYFRNIDHTNTQGAYLYTQYLIENLRKRDLTAKISHP